MNENIVGVGIVRNPKFKIKCWKKRGEYIMDIVDLIEKYEKKKKLRYISIIPRIIMIFGMSM